MAETWTYDNRTGRPAGRFVRLLGSVLPGVATVQRQVEPYAEEWRARNTAAVTGAASGRRWIVLGDSMMQGVGASSPTAGLVGQLAERLRRHGHELTVVNLSATGARVIDVLEQQLPVLEALPSPPPGAGADLVTVLIGSNDLFGGRRRRQALPGAMGRLVDRLPHGSVVATLPQPRAAARQANLHLDRAAREDRLVLVDMRVAGPDSWKGRLAPDWFHPNDAGYAAMADAFEPVLRAALS